MHNQNIEGFTSEELEAQTVSLLPDRRLMQTVRVSVGRLDLEIDDLLIEVDLGDTEPQVSV